MTRRPDKHDACADVARRVAWWLAGRVGLPRRLEGHIRHCPACRRRLAGAGRLRVAMALLKSARHGPDLLMCANRRTVAALSCDLRADPAAERLRYQGPRTPLRVRLARYGQVIPHAAACLLIALLLRAGALVERHDLTVAGREMLRDHYARRLDEDIVRSLLGSEPPERAEPPGGST